VVDTISLPIEHYIDLINQGKPFTLVRYGDGEWLSILGDKGRNCDGIKYTPLLQEELIRCLTEKKSYYYTLLKIAVTTQGSAINDFIVKNNIRVNWMEGTVFVAANRHGRLAPFIEALRGRRILYVGPKHLSSIGRKVFPIKQFLEISSKDAFQFRKDIRNKIIEIADDYDFIGFSAGPAAKIIIHDLYDIIGRDKTMFDFGSLWDGYTGVYSRLYMQRQTWKDMMALNLGEKHELV
jgi:hypothetical protein